MLGQSEKLKKWTRRDIILNVVVYLINFFVLIGLFFIAKEVVRVSFHDTKHAIGNGLSTTHFIVLIALLELTLFFYLFFEDRDFLRQSKNSEMLFLAMELSLVICYICKLYIDSYLRPFTLITLLILFLYNRRTAIFMNMLLCILVFLFDMFTGATILTEITSYEIINFLVLAFSSGVVASVVMVNAYSRLKVIVRSLFISIPVFICTIAIINIIDEEAMLGHSISALLSGPFSAILFILFLPIFESIFRMVSCFRYAELTDHRSKLIRKMIKHAPGTFNHSIVVANIAEACATAIGEDPVLARTCAYYHDIGKLRRPEFFKENQVDGGNPHDSLTPELSTNIIKSHAEDGYNLAIKNRLPQVIADVCREHHGTLPILFFYDKARKFTDGEVDINKFCYSGPKPQTKIAAIIMIADGSEAAVRSLSNRSRENVMEMVRKIVNDRLQLLQFEDCEITMKELNIIIHTIVNNLTGIYHKRVEYPEVNIEEIDMKEGQQ